MALNFFLRRSKSKTAREKAALPVSETASQEAAQTERDVRPKDEKKELPVLATKIHRTEKATALGMMNHYVFQLDRSANKQEFRKSMERHYDVHVEKVRIINVMGKKRRVKGVPGWAPGYKKAIVTVQPGEKIDIGV